MSDLDKLSYETLLVDRPADKILRVVLNRPASANALTTTMGCELIALFQAITEEPLAYRCIILTAAGDRVFCAGADLKERDGMDDEAFGRQHYLFERMMRAIWECPVPVIAALNGHTMAGGLELALNCDFIYAANHIRLGFPEVKRGIMPGGAGTQHLPRCVGEARAKEVILTGEPFSAQDALQWGLVNRLCRSEELAAEVLATAQVICANAPIATAQAKKAITHGMQMDVRTGMFFEIEAYGKLIPTADRQEGINAFVQKRPAVFRGR